MSSQIEEWINEAREKMASEKDIIQVPVSNIVSCHRNIKAWRQWYLRKNQPGNYIRSTRIYPFGFDKKPICKLQCFIKTKNKKLEAILFDQIEITEEAFEWTKTVDGFEYHDRPDLEYCILKYQEK